MYLTTLTISVSLFLSTVFAHPRASLEVVQIRQIHKRQDDIPSACYVPATGALSYATEIPTLPNDVIYAMVTLSNSCDVESAKGTIGAQVTSYESALQSWWTGYSKEIRSWETWYKSACPYASDLQPVSLDYSSDFFLLPLATCVDVSSDGTSEATETGSAEPASSETGTGSAAATTGTGSTESTKSNGGTKETSSAAGATGATTGGAPQPTLFAAAAGLVAGFVGVVAAL
ncbi:hypothetical protein K491DRAFT_718052 [Lophiostoma macrostomum CBS 122681]|uniref:Infection structure specific protein n=1 Tax=Lophiostoma macrostomum CBS 122681 TaxID=1314788 RepID=A0A6A6T147_9PLEO|nr:hypothetical protein K491DRAFT_718052 [Lophiostoma macrostomum CBS 122681]